MPRGWPAGQVMWPVKVSTIRQSPITWFGLIPAHVRPSGLPGCTALPALTLFKQWPCSFVFYGYVPNLILKNIGKDNFLEAFLHDKGQIISKEILVSSNYPKKRTNKFVFTTMTNSFVLFMGEFEITKKSFCYYLTCMQSIYLFFQRHEKFKFKWMLMFFKCPFLWAATNR